MKQARSIALSPRQRAWRVGLFIIVAGPLIGALLMLAAMLVASGWDGGAKPFALVEVLQLAAMFAVFGFLLGGLPALLSAMWLGRRTFLRGGFGYLEAIATAVVATVLGQVLLALLLGERRGLASGALAFLPVGVSSGVICRALLGRFGWIAAP